MKNLRTQLAAIAVVVSGLGLAGGAQAAFTFTGSTGAIAGTGTDAGVTLKSTAGVAAANGGALNVTSGTVVLNESNSATMFGASGFANGAAYANVGAQLAWQGTGYGWGMYSDSVPGSVPNHALDNGPATDANDKITGVGNTEGILLNFSASVSLNSISLGYKSGDADISIFRYTGSSATPTLSTASLTGMDANGWSLVGNYADLNAVNGTATNNNINTGNATSSWWLITAYNSAYGTGSGLTQGNDYFKVLGVSAGASCVLDTAGCYSNRTPSGVPEPTSLALVAIAGLGVVGARRRKVKAAA